MLVKQVMSTKLEAIAPTMTVRECAERMHQLGVGVLPVWQDGKPLGLVTDRRAFFRSAAGLGLAAQTAAQPSPEPDRVYWLRTLAKLTDPVLRHLAANPDHGVARLDGPTFFLSTFGVK